MRLVFFYMQESSSHQNVPWIKDQIATNKYVQKDGLPTEGYFYMLKQMLNQSIIDELVIIIESGRGSGAIKLDGIPVYVIPNIKYAHEIIEPNDILFIRGGFRTWFIHLEKWKKDGHWLLLYAANTGRSRWTIWDIVFDDITGTTRVDSTGRLFFYFKKPINPDLFHPISIKPIYDLCIGASFIHDKKGQWQAIKAVMEYKRLYGQNPSCILPGAFRHSSRTNDMCQDVATNALNVYFPGMVSRRELGKIYNQSKVFIHMGTGGQNDRGPLEAMACGTQLIVAGTKNRAPFTYDNPETSQLITDVNDYKKIALQIKLGINTYSSDLKKNTAEYFQKNSGVDVVLNDMKHIFDMFRQFPKPNIEGLRKLL